MPAVGSPLVGYLRVIRLYAMVYTPMNTAATEVGKGWKAKTLRVTVFFRLGWDVPVPTSRAFWRAACSEEPEVSERGVVHAQDVGRWNNGKLVVKVEPAGGDAFRLDLIWESAWYREDGADALRAFAGLLGNMVKSDQFPTASRLAFAANVGWPTPDRSEAYRQLAAMVPRVHFDAEMREAIFRFNRQKPPKDSGQAKPSDLPINRVNTWACHQFMPMFALNPALTAGQPLPAEFAAVCDMDISTIAEHEGAWDSSQVLAWLGCLIYEGVQIIEKGDPL